MAAPVWNTYRTHTPACTRAAIARPRLLDLLTDTLLDPAGAVTVATLTAPVGSGKTLLLSDWADRSRSLTTVAWLTVTEDDNSEATLAAASLSALRATGDPAVIAALQNLPDPDTGDLRVAIAESLGALGRVVVMVLDDAHLLHDRDILGSLATFLRCAPPTLRMVLSGRFEPPLALHRMRLDGRVLDVSARDLAFTVDEAESLLAEHDVHLDSADLAAIRCRTGGWAAGLRLAGITLARHRDPHAMIAEFNGDHRVVADYLVGEVLDHLDPTTRDFLIETSVPDTFNAALAETLTGNPDASGFIALIERENVLVEQVSGAPGWYRYHPLLREYLRGEVAHRGRAALADLERVASRWFAESGSSVHAMQHALHAEDDDTLLNLLCTVGFGAVLRGHGDDVLDVFTHAPARIRAHPVSRLVRAAAELDRGRDAAAASILGPVEVEWNDRTRPRPAWEKPHERALRLDHALRSGVIESALAGLDPGPAGGSGEPDVDAFVLTRLGLAEMHLGRLDRATRHLSDGLVVAQSADVPSVELEALVSLALIGACRCRLTEAKAGAEAADALARRHGLTATASARLALRLLEWIRYLRMDEPAVLRDDDLPAPTDRGHPVVADAADCLAEVLALTVAGSRHVAATAALERFFPGHRLPLPTALAALLAPEVHQALLDTGHATGTAEVADHLTRTLGAESGDVAVFSAVTALHHRRLDTARERLAPALDGDRRCTSTTVEILARLTAARVADGRADPIAVRDSLAAALAAAAPEGVARPFADAGVRELLDRNRGRFGVLDPFADRVLALVPVSTRGTEHQLTARELELLHELPSWRTAEQIAADLFVSVNTVKTHLRGIYRKLEVGSRRDAITAARRQGLL